ncbi:serine/threonine-protein phosphatase 7 long form homolog [Lycium barbarum]|uniref:serine/threonine-protein phosphatase 7 long form homolog n=1 Tax=Lycium barbarum TaxID=112863 RepID=UPI00293F2B0F|nr:serine/threonine-protein phosphatase 7 long form homolog [Lycium barbarum]
MEPNLHPWPFDPSVLYLQDTHKSQLLWDEVIDSSTLFRSRRVEHAWNILGAWPPHPRVLDIRYRGSIYHCVVDGQVQHDRALVTTMIEGWRPEAHTFHLCTGEATITLQDVEVMYGLQVDGCLLYIEEPQPQPPLSYREELTRLTDYVPREGEMWGQIRMSMVALYTHLHLLDIERLITDDKPQVDVNRSDRLYLLIKFGGILFPNTSGSYVSLKYLVFLKDLGELGCYIWGATVLAYLYRSLCKASTGDKRDVSGF